MKRLLHVLLAGLMPSGVMAQVPFLGRIPSRSNLRFNRQAAGSAPSWPTSSSSTTRPTVITAT